MLVEKGLGRVLGGLQEWCEKKRKKKKNIVDFEYYLG